jgi:hypothetical protein
MNNLFPELEVATKIQRGAIFSDCRKYRYALWRVWDELKPQVVFIGLNPSTANESTDDPTIKRVQAIARNLGYGGVYMMNLFAIISADPTVLKTCDDPIGNNNEWLEKFCIGDIIFAWGNFKEAQERSKEVAAMFPNAKALFINKNGTPKHPLYCKADIVPVLFNTGQGVQECDASKAQ